MKNTYLFFLLFVSCHLFSQISIVENDIADGGQDFIISNANPLDIYDIVSTGAAASWDFSGLTAMNQDTISWLDATDTNPAYFLLWFSADVAEQFTDGITTDTFSINDIYNFYDRSSDKLKQTGIAGTIGGIPLFASFSDPDIVYDFPIAFGNEDSSVSNYVFDLLGLGSFTETRNRKNIIDGWGTISTPLETYDVIRLHSVIQTEDILEYGGAEFPISYINHEYKWLAKEKGIPVLQINTTEAAGFETVTRVTYQDTAHVVTAIENNDFSADDMLIYPDPVQNILSLNISSREASAYLLEITDEAGNVKYKTKGSLHAGKNIIYTALQDEHLYPGMYFIRLYNDGGMLAVRKFIYLP